MVLQDVSLNSRLFVNNDVSFNSKLMVRQDVSLNSRLFVNNDVSFNSKLYVFGNTLLNGDLSLNSNLYVKGNVNGINIGRGPRDLSTNISIGYQALNTSGPGQSVAVGYQTLNKASTTDGNNDAFGYQALFNCSTGVNNTAIGYNALTFLTTSSHNTAIGRNAGNGDTTVGFNKQGNHNTFLGAYTGMTGDNWISSTAVGVNATITASNQIKLGTNMQSVFCGENLMFQTASDGNCYIRNIATGATNFLYLGVGAKNVVGISNASTDTTDCLQIFQYTDNDFYIKPFWGNLYLGGGNANLLKLSANDATVYGELRSDQNIYARKSLMIGQFAEMHETTPFYRFIFPFERNTINYGSGDQLTFTGTITYDTNCRIGNYSARFTNGTTAKFFSSDIPFTNASTSGFSTCFWFNSDGITPAYRIIQFYNSASDKIDVYFNLGYITVQLNGSGNAISNSSVTIVAGGWYHVGITISGTAVTIYVNGNSSTGTGTVSAITNSAKKMYIGSNGENTNGLSGLNIDQLILNFSVLSANDFLWIFKNKFELNVHNNLKLLTPLSAGFGSYTNLDFNNTTFNMGGIICTDLTAITSGLVGTYVTSMSFMLNYNNVVTEPMKITSTNNTGTNVANIQMNGNLTVEGNTTFTNLPTCSGTPTFNSQLATKAYVDSTVTASTSGSNTLTGLVVNGSTSDLNATVSISKNVGSAANFGAWQHTGQLQVQELNGNALALAMSTDGVGIIQGKKTNDANYKNISINPLGGNVGIGTITPSYRLSLGTLNANCKVAVYDDGTGNDWYGIGANSSNLTFGAGLASAGTPQMVLNKSSGHVGIGTIGPSTRLHVNGSSGSLLTLQNNTGGGSASYVNIDFFNTTYKAGSIQCKNLATGTWSSEMSFFVAINTTQLYEAIRITGMLQDAANCCDVKIFGDVESVSYNAVSDYRVKENVVPLNASFTVDMLNPVTYNLKSSGKQDIGFIAHEVQEFYPYLVNGVKDGPQTQSLNYNGLIGILTKEIKDLKKEMRIVCDANTKLNSDVSVLREANAKLNSDVSVLREANAKLNDDFSKLASEMSVLRDIVQELMPL